MKADEIQPIFYLNFVYDEAKKAVQMARRRIAEIKGFILENRSANVQRADGRDREFHLEYDEAIGGSERYTEKKKILAQFLRDMGFSLCDGDEFSISVELVSELQTDRVPIKKAKK